MRDKNICNKDLMKYERNLHRYVQNVCGLL